MAIAPAIPNEQSRSKIDQIALAACGHLVAPELSSYVLASVVLLNITGVAHRGRRLGLGRKGVWCNAFSVAILLRDAAPTSDRLVS